MVAICIYFQLHQPIRLKQYRIFDIGHSNNYFNDILNKEIFTNNSFKSYLPLNRLLLKLIKKYPGKFKVNFSISGPAINQMQKFAPEVLESFKELSLSGNVEFLGETNYHSFSFIYSRAEFRRQVQIYSNLIEELFFQRPRVFKNVEFLFNDDLIEEIENLGFEGILIDDSLDIFDLDDSNYIHSKKNSKVAILSKGEEILDENILVSNNRGDVVNLFYDYDKFKNLEMFEFLEKFVEKNINFSNINFITCSDAISKFSKKKEIEKPLLLDLYNSKISLWLSNKMQQDAILQIFELEGEIKKLKDKQLLEDWRNLTISDHFLYMRTDTFKTEHSIYQSPYDAYVYFMNALNDLISRIKLKQEKMNMQQTMLKEPKKSGILSDIKLAVKN